MQANLEELYSCSFSKFTLSVKLGSFKIVCLNECRIRSKHMNKWEGKKIDMCAGFSTSS